MHNEIMKHFFFLFKSTEISISTSPNGYHEWY